MAEPFSAPRVKQRSVLRKEQFAKYVHAGLGMGAMVAVGLGAINGAQANGMPDGGSLDTHAPTYSQATTP